MNARDYWGTTKRLDSQYRKEADNAVAKMESEKQAKAAEAAEERRQKITDALPRKVEMWKRIKTGDILFGQVVVAKKNKYSVVSTLGNKYTIEEVIGSKAAELYRHEA